MSRIRLGVNPNEHILHERLYRAASQRLNAVSDLAQRQSSKARSRRSGQLNQNAGVDAVRTVCSRTDQSRQGLAQLIGQLLRHVLNGVVNGGRQRQAGEVGVIRILTNGCGGIQDVHAQRASNRTFRGLRGQRGQRNVHEHFILVTGVLRQIQTSRATDERSLRLQILAEPFVIILHSALGQVG